MPTGARGATLTLSASFADGTGTAVTPSSPLVDIVNPSGVTVVSNATPTEVATGLYEYDYAVAGDAPLGSWTAHWTGAINGVNVEADEVFQVVAAGTIGFGSGGGSTCEPWATVADVCTPCDDYEMDEALLEDSLQLATDVLFQFTGRQWPGECTETVRPCGYGTAIARGWCGCMSSSSCGCKRLSELWLPNGPVVSVSEVKIDGDVLDPARYRVDDQRTLVYLPASPSAVRQGWPCCQRLDRADTEADTWSVTYTWGSLPPIGGVKAAAALGCQLALACQPEAVRAGACRLPQRVTTITRQGVSMALLDPLTLFADGQTGLAEVDLWVGSVLAGRQRRPGMVYRPGAGATVRRVGT